MQDYIIEQYNMREGDMCSHHGCDSADAHSDVILLSYSSSASAPFSISHSNMPNQIMIGFVDLICYSTSPKQIVPYYPIQYNRPPLWVLRPAYFAGHRCPITSRQRRTIADSFLLTTYGVLQTTARGRSCGWCPSTTSTARCSIT